MGADIKTVFCTYAALDNLRASSSLYRDRFVSRFGHGAVFTEERIVSRGRMRGLSRIADVEGVPA
jgi:hypothetical protein